MSDIPTQLWDEPPETEEEARERVEEIRGYINEELQVFFGGQEFHRIAARLYVELATEHVEELDPDKYRYAPQAETDLKNITFRLD